MQCLSIPSGLEDPHLFGARHVRDSCLSTHEFGQREAGVLGERFHLGAGLYFGFDGHHHGEWRGEYHEDGEYFADCTEHQAARRLHQIRDCIIHVRDGDASGYANYQTVVSGEWPELGLSADNSFM